MEGSTTTAMTMTSLIESITSVFTAAIGWVGTVADTVAGEPLLLLGCILGFVGLGVGLFRRLLNI